MSLEERKLRIWVPRETGSVEAELLIGGSGLRRQCEGQMTGRTFSL